MEKIQLALEKARAERAAVLELGEAQEVRERAEAAARAAAAVERPSGPARTRSVAPPPRLLERQRVAAATAGAAAEAFRMLRTRVLQALEARGGRTLAVCAARPEEGKTVIAANLAVACARHLHRSALLVDLDLRRPSVARTFGIEAELGLSDHLEGRAALEDCLVSPGIERLVLLPQVRSVADSSELLASPRMEALAAELDRRYPDRIVIYDCPPLLTTDDALVALDYASACLLVVREGRTRRAELVRSAELIGAERLIGTVLNDARWALASRYETYYAGYAPT